MDKAGLVQKKVSVTRGGKTFMQTVYVRADDTKATAGAVKPVPVSKEFSPKVSLESFEGIKDRDTAMKYLRDSGVTWNESDNAGINWMRAKMAVKAVAKATGTTPQPTSQKMTFEDLAAHAVRWLRECKTSEDITNAKARLDELVEQNKEGQGYNFTTQAAIAAAVRQIEYDKQKAEWSPRLGTGGWDKPWNQTMKNMVKPFREGVLAHARELTSDFLHCQENGSEVYGNDVDKLGGYSGRLGDIEEKKFFHETYVKDNWKDKVGDNYRARIALYNNTAEHYEKEYWTRRNMKKKGQVDYSEEEILRYRVAANIAASYARSMQSILEDWMQP